MDPKEEWQENGKKPKNMREGGSEDDNVSEAEGK
jgi:hypothetical protein